MALSIYGAGNFTNGNSFVNNGAEENTLLPQTQAASGHCSGLSVSWTPEEDSVLKDIIARYAASRKTIYSCPRIAKKLNNRNAREVALRFGLLNVKKENGERGIDNHSPMMSPQNVTDSSPKAQDHPPVKPMARIGEFRDKAINSAFRHMIKQIDQDVSQAFALINTQEEDTCPLIQAHNNITTILNNMNITMPEKMKEAQAAAFSGKKKNKDLV